MYYCMLYIYAQLCGAVAYPPNGCHKVKFVYLVLPIAQQLLQVHIYPSTQSLGKTTFTYVGMPKHCALLRPILGLTIPSPDAAACAFHTSAVESPPAEGGACPHVEYQKDKNGETKS